MFRWAIIFLVIALIAALFGYGGLVVGLEGFAKALFYTFAIVFAVFLFAAVSRRPH